MKRVGCVAYPIVYHWIATLYRRNKEMTVKRTMMLVILAIALSGCASLAVRPCDSIPTRDSKYTARFLLGIMTLGISEGGIQREQMLEAQEGWRFCPPPVGWQPGPPQAMGQPPVPGMPRTPGMLVNATRWTVNVYLDVEPGSGGIPPLFTLRPGESRQIALVTGPHRIVAMSGTASTFGVSRPLRYERQVQIDPRDRSFRLQLSEADFR